MIPLNNVPILFGELSKVPYHKMIPFFHLEIFCRFIYIQMLLNSKTFPKP